MGKIEKRNLLPSNCRYFDKTFIEMILEKSCVRHICLAHSSFVPVTMETIMQKMEKENTYAKKKWKRKILKKLSPQKPYTL